MENAKDFATQVLTALGCRVNAIPESDDKRADLTATDDASTYLIEVKHKLDDPELFRNHTARLARGEVVSCAATTSHSNRVSGILKHGRDQLDRTPGPIDSFRLIWFHADGIDHDLYWTRAFATFYGRVYLWPKTPPGNDLIECYYFDYSAACSFPSLDAMVLSDDHSAQLLLNEFSNNLDRFTRSALHARFARDNAVVDPRPLAASGRILVCRSDLPRKNDQDILDAMRKETGVLYSVVRFSQHSASVAVDGENVA